MRIPDSRFMEAAFEEAAAAAARGEVPIGAVLVHNGEILARAGNRTEELNDPTAHAEVLAIRAAGQRLNSPRLVDCDLYVTLEPCPLCATAISFARIRALHFAAFDPKGGGVEHGPCIFHQPTCHWKPEVTGGIDADRAATQLKDFFAARR